MSEISCDICMDLLPLVCDGIASEDSKAAVEAHVKTCEMCRRLYESGRMGDMDVKVTAVDTVKAFEKFRRKLQMFSGMLLMFGIFFGLSLTAGDDMFYNSLIMPVIGALGYYVFREKALYTVPGLLLITYSFINFFGLIRGVEYMDFLSMTMWVFIYSIFVWIGILVAWLLHFAFRKDN